MPKNGIETTATASIEAPPRRFGAEELTFAALVLLSIVGIAVSDFSNTYGLTYWLVMVPLFAVASIFTSWFRARKEGLTVAGILWRQIFHWAATALAVYLIYLFTRTGRIPDQEAGLLTLLVLALATFLAGVHFDWRLSLLGVVLGAAAACALLIKEFFWFLLIPALVVGIIAVMWRK